MPPRRALIINCIDGADKGIIPLTCDELFTRVENKTANDPSTSFTIEVSYIEVIRTHAALEHVFEALSVLDLQ